MSGMVKLTIDGKKVDVPEGTNIIDAAETVGVHIPNLCYLKGTKGIGACRLCLVEVEGGKSPVVAGKCTLQKYAYDMEIQESSFSRKKFGYEPDTANTFIKRDPEYCILCARCVRVCKEQGTNVLEFMGRGVGAKVITAEDKPLQESNCTFCGSCVDACPVNALLEADRWRKGREWDYDNVKSVCLLCGNGCDINVSTMDGKIQKINSAQAEGSAEKYICAYGRFGFDCLEAETRLTSPMKRVDGKLQETTWDDALSLAAAALKKAGKDAGLVSIAGIQNEDALAMKALAKGVVKTKNFDTTMSLYADAEALVNSQSADLDSADLVILV
ncbi:MAG: 2Fe-2S iron-sulfur cluster-binding protein, partial [Nitrospirota bacterium]